MVRRSRKRLSAADEARVEAAVTALEQRSAAELAIVIAQRSSTSYGVYPALWSACLALLAGWTAALIDPDSVPSHLMVIQGAVLLSAALLLCLTPLGLKLVPRAVKRSRAAAMARTEFARLVNNRTRGKNGVLLYLSAAEHYIELIPDSTIAAEIARERWQAILRDFRARTKRSPLSDNLVQLIDECAAVLEARFPAKPGQANELPNRVTEI